MAAWSDLTWNQLFDVWGLYLRFAETDGARLRAEVWCLLNQKRPTGNVRWNEERGVREIELIPRTGRKWDRVKRKDVRDKHSAWVSLPEWTDRVIKETKFLEAPFGTDENTGDGLMEIPAKEVKIGGIRYKLPSALITDLTFEQYTNMEAQTDDAAIFLSYAIVPSRWAWTERVGESWRFRLHRTFEYNSKVAEEVEKRFRKAIDKTAKNGNDALFIQVLHKICLQHLQSCMRYYARQFPDLFRDSGKREKREPLIATVGTMNAVMKYNGYTRQQEVFDSNAIFILEILNTMAKEAHEIEKMNAKIKKK